MKKNSETEASDFNKLKGLGFEFKTPQDEFSYQPDSGGSASGKIAKQEYGIDVDSDSEANEIEDGGEDLNQEDPQSEIPGESAWSQEHRLPEDQLDAQRLSEKDQDLSTLIERRIHSHPNLSQLKISIEVEDGAVTLKGKVPSELEKLLVREAIKHLPGVTFITNGLTTR